MVTHRDTHTQPTPGRGGGWEGKAATNHRTTHPYTQLKPIGRNKESGESLSTGHIPTAV
ncbi:uncharacterized protein BDZ83DRAFT_615430 [Colletotrichum acutatum]|uniref:Uncharacterized protein n=1 Tax=Glomerella acutata TaxID=27357 RepID=A0AAD8XGN2_GLOAC|nr:uncharacterized protein BDZ83DRAFT_615430 [Colletotrichum acutatum]KAK1726537.1 hypothetical protein BDZ83DRAFT_615430 [Colletotrichum acutatum]